MGAGLRGKSMRASMQRLYDEAVCAAHGSGQRLPEDSGALFPNPALGPEFQSNWLCIGITCGLLLLLLLLLGAWFATNTRVDDAFTNWLIRPWASCWEGIALWAAEDFAWVGAPGTLHGLGQPDFCVRI